MARIQLNAETLKPHDHRHCVADVMAAAAGIAAARGVRLTPVRAQVLKIVCEGHKPLGAYDILERLARNRERAGARAAPPTVYRALSFLLEQGFVHRIDSLNAFVACFAPGETHRGFFLICETCSSVAEIGDKRLETALNRVTSDAGFAAARAMVEIAGRCAACRRNERK